MSFLAQAAPRPHHAYLFAGPEGGGKSLAARAFAAALLCELGGCGECRDCRLALDDSSQLRPHDAPDAQLGRPERA